MAGTSVGAGKLKNAVLSNLPGVISAIVLAAGVGYICSYNFFLLFAVFLLLYFVAGTAAEFLIVALHIEKVKIDRKKRGSGEQKGTRQSAHLMTALQSAGKRTRPDERQGIPGGDFFAVEDSSGDDANGEEKKEAPDSSEATWEFPYVAEEETLVPNQKARLEYAVSARVKVMKSDDLVKKTEENENEKDDES